MTGDTDTKTLGLAARFLAESAPRVDAFLARQMDARTDVPPRLLAAMRHTLDAGGKRLRPALCLVAARLAGGPAKDVLSAACAIEMLHTFSLIHDDLPAMDDDDLRRGRPTCHVVYGEATAILAGDALLTNAFGLLSEFPGDPGRVLEAVRELARATGPQGMMGGQQRDLEGAGKAVTLEDVELIHRGKTAALLGASVAIGAILGGEDERGIEALRRYGSALGMAFQAVDDVLDATTSREVLGKTPGKDQAKQMPTLVRLLGVDGARERAREWSQRAISELAPFASRPDAAVLHGFVHLGTARDH